MTPVKLTRTAFACAALAACSLASAESPAAPDLDEVQKRMANAVNEYAIKNALRLIEPGDALRLLAVARQRAIAESCEGYEMDNDRYRAVMQDILADVSSLTAPDQENLPLDIIGGAYATSFGGYLAVAAYDLERFCATAAEVRDAMKGDVTGRLNVLK